jgi:thymidylate synthase (FAD)
MSTKLVWITPDAEKVIGYCARVSNPANQDNPDVTRLLRYCVDHGHWSIFEMASMCIEVKTTRAIAAQLLRHRSFSFQEFSQRYATVVEDIDVPEMRLAGTHNRQSSLPLPKIEELTKEQQDALYLVGSSIEFATDVYRDLVKNGMAAETARMVLPLCTPTTMYMSGTIRSWIHYVQLRTRQDTQLEHRDIAQGVQNILLEHLPITMEALA